MKHKSMQFMLPLDDGARDAWSRQVSDTTADELFAKHAKGRIEHNTDLGAVPLNRLMVEIKQEHLDSIIYYAELQRRVEHMWYLLHMANKVISRDVVIGNLADTDERLAMQAIQKEYNEP